MNRKATNTMITTACVGMAIGTAAYMMSNQHDLKKRGKKLRRNAGKTLRQVGGFIDNVSSMIG